MLDWERKQKIREEEEYRREVRRELREAEKRKKELTGKEIIVSILVIGALILAYKGYMFFQGKYDTQEYLDQADAACESFMVEKAYLRQPLGSNASYSATGLETKYLGDKSYNVEGVYSLSIPIYNERAESFVVGKFSCYVDVDGGEWTKDRVLSLIDDSSYERFYQEIIELNDKIAENKEVIKRATRLGSNSDFPKKQIKNDQNKIERMQQIIGILDGLKKIT